MMKYDHMSQEEYRTELQKIFDEIPYASVLRHFYIMASEAVKDEAWMSRKEGR